MRLKNLRACETRKESSRNAARNRRSVEAQIFRDMLSMLPINQTTSRPLSTLFNGAQSLSVDVLTDPLKAPFLQRAQSMSSPNGNFNALFVAPGMHIDKISIVRLSLAFIKLRQILLLHNSLLPDISFPPNDKSSLNQGFSSLDVIEKQKSLSERVSTGREILRALDCFFMIVSGNGTLLYLSDNVENLIGISKMCLLGQKLIDLVHPCDLKLFSCGLQHTNDSFDETPCNNNNNNMKMARKFNGQNYSSDSSSPPSSREFQLEDRVELMSKLASEETNVTASNKNNSPSLYSKPVDMILRLKSLTSCGGSTGSGFSNPPNNRVDELNTYRGDWDERKSSFIIPNSPNHVLSKSSPETSPVRNEAASVARKSIIVSNNNNNCSLSGVNNNKVISEKCWPDLTESSIFLVNPTTAPAATGATVHQMRLNRPLTNQHNFKVMHVYGQTIFKTAKKRMGDPLQASFSPTDPLYPNSLNGSSIVCSLLVASPVFDQQLKSSIVDHFLNVPSMSPNKTMIDAKTESKSVIYTPLSTFNKCIDIDRHSIAFMISKHKLDMKIIYFDERIAKLLGYEIWHLIGRSYFDFLHVLDLERFRKNMKSLHENGEFETGYYRLLAQTGGYAWINTQATTFIHSTDTNFNSGSNHNALANSIFRPSHQAVTAPTLHQSLRRGEDHRVEWNMNNYSNSLANTNSSSIVAKQCNEINNGGEVVGCNIKEGEEGESFKRHNGDTFKGSERIMSVDGMISNSPLLGNNTMTPKMAESTFRDSLNRTASPTAAPLTIRTGNYTTTFQRDYVKQIVCRHNIISHCENGDHVLSDSQSKAAILRGHDPKFKEFSTESSSSNVNLNGAWSSIHQNTEFLLNLPPRLKSSPHPPNSIIDPYHASKDLAILKFNKVLPQPPQQRLTVIRDKKSFSPDREICNRCPTPKTSLPEPFFVVPELGGDDDGDWGSVIQLDEDVGGAQEKPAVRYNISYLDPQGDAATSDQGCDSLGKAGTEDQAIIYNRAPSLIQLLPARLVSKNDIFLKDNHQGGSAKGKTSSKSKPGNRKKRGSVQNMISNTAPVNTKQLNHEVSVGDTNLKARWTATSSPCVTTAKKPPTVDITDPNIERLSFLNGSRENSYFKTPFPLTPTTGIYNINSTAQYPNTTTHLTEIQKLPGFPSSSNCYSNTEDSSCYKHIPTSLEYAQSGDLRHFTRDRSDSIDNIIEDIISLEDDARRRLGESKNMALITTRNTLLPRAELTNYHMVKMSRFDCNNNSINSTTAPLVYSTNFNCAGSNGYVQGKQPMILQNLNFERNQLNFSPASETLQSPNPNRNILNNGLALVDNKRLSFSKNGHIINYNNLHHYNCSKSRTETWKNQQQQTFLPNLNHQEIIVSSSGGTTYKYFDPPATCNFKTNFPPTTPTAYVKNGNSKLVGVFNEIGDVFQMEPQSQQQLLNPRNNIYSPHGINGGTATPLAQTLFRSTKYHVDSLPIPPNPITPNYNLNQKNGAVDNILWSPKTILSSSSKKKLDSKAVPKHYLNSVLVNLLKNGEDLNTGYKCQITSENEKSFVDYAASKSPRSFDVNDFTYDWPTLLNPLDQNFINIVDAADPASNPIHLITSRDDKLSFDGRFQSYREATAATTTVPPINNKVMILVNNNNDTDTTNNNNNNNDLSLLFDQSSDLPVFLRDNLESPLLYENSLIEPLLATPSPENFFLNMFTNTLVDDPHVNNNSPSKLKMLDNHHQHSLTSDIFITDDYPNNTNHIFDDDNIVFPEESNVLDDLIY